MTDTSTESLKAQFDALHAERERTWAPAKLAQNITARRRLVEAFDPVRAVRVGDKIAPFTLDTSDGGRVTLDTLIADGPAVLVFFRWAGCPACNIALPYYDRQLRPELDRRGVPLLAISPHLPEAGLDDIRSRHQLGFKIAADRDNRLGRQFGISFDRDVIPDGQPSPGWIGELTGTGTAELPQPAVLIVDRDATVRFVAISPDWLDRAEAPTILSALIEIMQKAAA